MNRRTLLRRGALFGALGLAGCAGGDGGSGESTTTTTESTTTTATTTEPTTTTTTTEPTTITTTSGGDSGTPDDGDGGGGGSTTTTTTEVEAPSNVEVTVAPGGELRFAPETFTLQVGGTVTWTWARPGHNVVPETQPDGAGWSGSPGAPEAVLDSGETYEFTADVPGAYAYYCRPHRNFGMDGSFTVVE